MKIIDILETLTTWENIQSGVPAIFVCWRGINGAAAPLNTNVQQSLGRKQLLGDGIYVAPTKYLAAKYGVPVKLKVLLHNPYVTRIPPGIGWIWVLKQLDINHIQEKHDGIVIANGKTQYREDLRQAVIFPPYAKQAHIYGAAGARKAGAIAPRPR